MLTMCSVKEIAELALSVVLFSNIILLGCFDAKASSFPEYECQPRLVHDPPPQPCHCSAGNGADQYIFVVWVHFNICHCNITKNMTTEMVVFFPLVGNQSNIYDGIIIPTTQVHNISYHGSFISDSVSISYFKEHYSEAQVFIFLTSAAFGNVTLPSQAVYFHCTTFCSYNNDVTNFTHPS